YLITIESPEKNARLAQVLSFLLKITNPQVHAIYPLFKKDMENGDAVYFTRKAPGKRLKEIKNSGSDNLLEIYCEIGKNIAALHGKDDPIFAPIIHGDLNPTNILVDYSSTSGYYISLIDWEYAAEQELRDRDVLGFFRHIVVDGLSVYANSEENNSEEEKDNAFALAFNLMSKFFEGYCQMTYGSNPYQFITRESRTSFENWIYGKNYDTYKDPSKDDFFWSRLDDFLEPYCIPEGPNQFSLFPHEVGVCKKAVIAFKAQYSFQDPQDEYSEDE
ncbi:MAG: hypothetical protein LBJ71_00505, partial [Holosporaceae bacterium]|nr:hypothetical protein [Holosporaceae bacterium]